MPKFSIVIPIIKGKFLPEAIDSVLSQSFSDWEIILYNDCSSDDIAGIVSDYKDSRIRYYLGEENLGSKFPTLAWNKAISFANGDFICLLGDDDFLSSNYLEEVNALIEKYPKADLFRVLLKRVNEEGKIIASNEDLPEHETWYQSMNQRNVLGRMQSTCEFVLRRSKLLEIGGYVSFPRACGSDDATYLLIAKENGIASTNKAVGFWRKSALNISDNDSEEMNQYKVGYYLEWERNFLDNIFFKDVSLATLYNSIDLEKKRALQLIESRGRELTLISNELKLIKNELKSKKAEILGIYSSFEWKIGLFFQKIVKKIFPNGSLRRRAVIVIWKIIKSSFKLIFKTKRVIKGAIFLFQNFFFRHRKRKERKINMQSKKIVFIDHSYHAKTRSSEFLTNYLKDFFDVEIIMDHSWKGEEFTDLSFIDESYFAIIFWQSLPDTETLKKIKNDNLIFFPMYDQSGRLGFDYWHALKDLKIMNFSMALHEKLSKWGFDSMYIQYFPKPHEFMPGKVNEVFFWQRVTNININTLIKLIGQQKLKIHMHTAIDPPFHKFVYPSIEDGKKYCVTYSDWFEKREEMLEVIDEKGIYVAPREYEGIGLSFIEAMAKGKAVIAIDHPTMNEYIKHNETGYLFELDKLKEIDFSEIEKIQKNTYEFMCQGFENWEKNKKNIISFIKSK